MLELLYHQTICRAQFVVGAARIKTRTKAFYEAARDYMLHNDLRGARLVTSSMAQSAL